MRILVTGAQGQLGLACLAVLPAAGHETAGVDLRDGDLAEPGMAARLLARHAPDRVIHAAAFTAVDRAESAREQALAANATATSLLAAACRERGCALTYLSTDYVFGGRDPAGYAEDAALEPLNWYGYTKALGEAAVAALGDDCPWQIVRTSWLFGHGPANFVRTILRLLDERDALQVVDDQRGSPTYAPDLAVLLEQLAVTGTGGVLHGTNGGVCTWHELARETARLAGHDPDRIRPCPTTAYPTAAARPACSVLRDTRLAGLGLAPLPSWQDALARYLAWLLPGAKRGIS